ncbi:hypothetical protein B566_EDAN010134 [Ephemera danica]|nr:hypothetical protein B566_EDAN010134 [Ephemera danica]
MTTNEKDAEAGEAETEATEEKCVKDDKNADVEDGLETVKLEPQDPEDPEKQADDLLDRESLLLDRLRTTFHQNKWFLIGSAVFLILLFVIIALAISGPRYPRLTEMLVDGRYINAVTSCGIVQGLLDEGEFVFHGIPYAMPPVGERRFAPAEPLHRLDACWNNTFKAWHNESELGPPNCWQYFRNGSIDGSEDCLTLDVYTRKVRYDAPLPVVFLVSTETLVGGRTWRPARGMARQRDVVFVQPRFRLGPLGFLAASALSRSAYPPRSGNYALSDLLAALDWVRINIEHFGGDPKSVTIVGHRGGASLVAALTALPKRRGAITNRPFKQTFEIIGTTAHVEASPELFTRKDWTQQANFVNHVRGSVLGSQSVPQGLANEVLARYKPPSWPMLAAMISDMRTVCPLYASARRIATIAAANERTAKYSSAVHFYVATQPRNTSVGFVADVGSDIETILGLYEARSPEQKRYLAAMQNFFYRFVWHGDLPTGSTGMERSTALPQNVIVVGQDLAIQSTYQNCDFWIQRELASKYGRVE